MKSNWVPLIFSLACDIACKKSGSWLFEDNPTNISTGETSKVTCIPPCKSRPRLSSDSLMSLNVKSETKLYTGLFQIESKYFCFFLKSIFPSLSLEISVASPWILCDTKVNCR